jgi:hypothetical protein
MQQNRYIPIGTSVLHDFSTFTCLTKQKIKYKIELEAICTYIIELKNPLIATDSRV